MGMYHRVRTSQVPPPWTASSYHQACLQGAPMSVVLMSSLHVILHAQK